MISTDSSRLTMIIASGLFLIFLPSLGASRPLNEGRGFSSSMREEEERRRVRNNGAEQKLYPSVQNKTLGVFLYEDANCRGEPLLSGVVQPGKCYPWLDNSTIFGIPVEKPWVRVEPFFLSREEDLSAAKTCTSVNKEPHGLRTLGESSPDLWQQPCGACTSSLPGSGPGFTQFICHSADFADPHSSAGVTMRQGCDPSCSVCNSTHFLAPDNCTTTLQDPSAESSSSSAPSPLAEALLPVVSVRLLSQGYVVPYWKFVNTTVCDDGGADEHDPSSPKRDQKLIVPCNVCNNAVVTTCGNWTD